MSSQFAPNSFEQGDLEGGKNVVYKNKYLGDKKLSKTKKKLVQEAYKVVKPTLAEQFAEAAVDNLVKAERYYSKDKKMEELEKARKNLSEAQVAGAANPRFSLAEQYANILVNKSLNDLSLNKKAPLATTKKAAQIGPRILTNERVDTERALRNLEPYAKEVYNTSIKPRVFVEPVFAPSNLLQTVVQPVVQPYAAPVNNIPRGIFTNLFARRNPSPPRFPGVL